MAIAGMEFPVIDGLSVNSQLGRARYDFSADGLFRLRPGLGGGCCPGRDPGGVTQIAGMGGSGRH